jgi:hypothetical protein
MPYTNWHLFSMPTSMVDQCFYTICYCNVAILNSGLHYNADMFICQFCASHSISWHFYTDIGDRFWPSVERLFSLMVIWFVKWKIWYFNITQVFNATHEEMAYFISHNFWWLYSALCPHLHYSKWNKIWRHV